MAIYICNDLFQIKTAVSHCETAVHTFRGLLNFYLQRKVYFLPALRDNIDDVILCRRELHVEGGRSHLCADVWLPVAKTPDRQCCGIRIGSEQNIVCPPWAATT